MDIQLARTFLSIVQTGSFAAAALRLNVAQTTVSARIHTLETELGRALFVRNKAGAVLTDAGRQFLRYAPTLVRLWERARQQVAMPPGRSAALSIGAEPSLWHPFLLRFLLHMKRSAPGIAITTQLEVPADLLRLVGDGVLDAALLYAPHAPTGLVAEKLFEERLILVTTSGARRERAEYVYVDWGPDFAMQHDAGLPERANPGVRVGFGPLGLDYILEAGGSGYLRERTVRAYLQSGKLRRVKGVPEFVHPAYAVHSAGADPALLRPALEALRAAAAEATG